MLSEEDEDSSEDDEHALPSADPRPIGAPRIGAAASAAAPAVYRPPPTESKKTPTYRIVTADSTGNTGVGSYAKHVRARRASAVRDPGFWLYHCLLCVCCLLCDQANGLSQAAVYPKLDGDRESADAERPLGAGHVRRAAPVGPATAQSTTTEHADPDLEFAALASALGVDLASEEYLHDIIYEAILAPLPR